MDVERLPEYANDWKVFDSLVEYSRELIGESAIETISNDYEYQFAECTYVPKNSNAASFTFHTGQFLQIAVLGMGDPSPYWELGYEDSDVELVRNIIESIIAGRVETRKGFGRANVQVTLADGNKKEAVTFDGCLIALIPHPGWRKQSPRRFEPYRAI